MAVVWIERPESDSRLQKYRNVRDAELLRASNCFVAEGRLVVERLLRSRHRVESLLLSPASHRALEPELAAFAPDVPIYLCETPAFETITGVDIHRGCLAIGERPELRLMSQVIGEAEIVVVLEGVADADNVGSVFRNAAAFGVGAVLLSPSCCDPLYRKAIRTSMGHALNMPFARIEPWPGDLAALKALGFTLIALTPRAEAIDLSSCAKRQPRQRLALMLGGEGHGLTAGAESHADVCARIPMAAGVDSLNLAAAAAVGLYYFTVAA